jgi:hypothetical protein
MDKEKKNIRIVHDVRTLGDNSTMSVVAKVRRKERWD